jgi:hypothetical protein
LHRYVLATEWVLAAPIERVWEALVEAESWPRWWRYVEDVSLLTPGEADGIGGVAFEQPQRAIAGVGERAAEHDALGLPREFQMLVAKGAAPLEVIGRELVDQQVVHRVSFSRRCASNGTPRRRASPRAPAAITRSWLHTNSGASSQAHAFSHRLCATTRHA